MPCRESARFASSKRLSDRLGPQVRLTVNFDRYYKWGPHVNPLLPPLSFPLAFLQTPRVHLQFARDPDRRALLERAERVALDAAAVPGAHEVFVEMPKRKKRRKKRVDVCAPFIITVNLTCGPIVLERHLEEAIEHFSDMIGFSHILIKKW